MTPKDMETQIIDWIDEALPNKLTEWPKQKNPISLDIIPEVEGVSKIKIIIQKDTGVHTVIPISYSQVYIWIPNEGWYPTLQEEKRCSGLYGIKRMSSEVFNREERSWAFRFSNTHTGSYKRR